VTNSLQVADVLHRSPRPDLTVVLTGGVRTPSDALVGPVAVNAVRSLHLDVLFLGVHGIAADVGLTTPNLLEAETDRALVAVSARLVVVADHEKWGVRGLSRIAGSRTSTSSCPTPDSSAQARPRSRSTSTGS
jgi:Transcriptional regulators of sugar metabolism